MSKYQLLNDSKTELGIRQLDEHEEKLIAKHLRKHGKKVILSKDPVMPHGKLKDTKKVKYITV